MIQMWQIIKLNIGFVSYCWCILIRGFNSNIDCDGVYSYINRVQEKPWNLSDNFVDVRPITKEYGGIRSYFYSDKTVKLFTIKKNPQ